MKKKSLIVLMTVTLVIVAFGLVGPASAKQPNNMRAVFEADIVPAGTHPLEKGEVYIREALDNSPYHNFKVEIEGAAIETTYEVFLKFVVPGSPTEIIIHLGNFETDPEGEGKLVEPDKPEENPLCFGEGDFFACNPWIEIHSGGTLQFVSGFALAPCPESPESPSG